MKKRQTILGGIIFALIGLTFAGCQDSWANSEGENGAPQNADNRTASQESKDYWYDGTAEITTYKLEQARYGEMREGTAVMVFVTEPFSKTSNTKSDRQKEDDVPVLKLNKMKNFNTGIYPYSIMTSTFLPFEGAAQSLKISFTMQEWCGTMYSEMRNKDGQLIFDLHSYFEGESFKNKKIKATYLEDDLWSLIRLNPESLPSGKVQMIPSMSYLRLKHQPLKTYDATVKKTENSDGTTTYSIRFDELDRSISIDYESTFPHAIVKWEETYLDGGKRLTTSAERIEQIKSDYWNKSGNQHSSLRKELGLD